MEEIQRWQQEIQNCSHGGPGPEHYETPWFRQSIAFADHKTPLDILIDNGSTVSDDTIRTALVLTINIIVDNFHFALTDVGSKRLFASMAVDAWVDEGFRALRMFLVRTILVGIVQSQGASRIIEEINQTNENTEGRILIKRIKEVLQSHDAGLKSILKCCLDTVCNCLDLAQILNEEKEILSNPKVSRDTILARRKERDLPPILKANSKYWGVKNKAVDFLKRGELDEAKKLYLHARGMLEKERTINAIVPVHQIEWMNMIGEERGKICSNLSMICLRQNLKEEALQYADMACYACPGWYKSYCRRALALIAQGKYDDAQVAIYKAMSKQRSEKDRKECLKIQLEIETELNASELEPPQNPLYSIKLLDSDRTKQVGTISAISDQDGIMDIVYSYLTPTDVAQLERTSKRYANVERTRRIAIGSGFLFVDPILKDTEDTVENVLINYINSNDSSTVALQKFVSQIYTRKLMFPPKTFSFVDMMTHVKMDPKTCETIVSIAVFSKRSSRSAHVTFDLLDVEFPSRRDFQIARFLFHGDDAVYALLKRNVLDQIGLQLKDESDESGFTERFFKHSLDLDVMKVAMAINDDDNDHYQLKDAAFTALNNSMLVKSAARRREMSKDDPLYDHNMSFLSIHTEHIPNTNDYPGEVDWERGLFDRDSIQQYWADEPTMFRMWKVALFKALKWVQELEKAGLVSDYLLLNRIVMGEEVMKNPNIPINLYSLGSFLVMESVECGGAVSMSIRLKNEENMTDLFYDYYSFLKLYRTGFPASVDYSNRVLAARHSYSHLR